MDMGHIKGLVAEIGECGRVKVRLPEYEDLVTDWLPVVQAATLGARTWAVPRLDTQVVVLPGQGVEDAVVLGAIYSQPDPPPFGDNAVIGMVADDGVEISYDPGASRLTITSPKLIKIVATKIDIEADVKLVGDSDVTGDVRHTGDMEQTGNARRTGTSDQTGAATVTGPVTVTGDMTLTGNVALAGNIAQAGALSTGGISVAPGAGGGGGGGATIAGAVEISGAASISGPLAAPSVTAGSATIGGIDFDKHVHPTSSPGAPTGGPQK